MFITRPYAQILTGTPVHLISSPLALASGEYAPKAWTNFRDIPALKDIHFIQGSVKNVDCDKKQAVVTESETGSSLGLEYDFLVAATGLRRVWPVVPQAKSRQAYLSEAAEHIEAVRKARDGVVVIGGGKEFLTCPENPVFTTCRCCRDRDGSRNQIGHARPESHLDPF